MLNILYVVFATPCTAWVHGARVITVSAVLLGFSGFRVGGGVRVAAAHVMQALQVVAVCAQETGYGPKHESRWAGLRLCSSIHVLKEYS